MNINLLEALDTFEKEKGISRDVLIDIILKSIKSAYKKNYGTKNVDVEMDNKFTKLNVYQVWQVVENVENLQEEMSLEEAKRINPKVQIGEEIRKKINLKKDFKRIAAQTAKQVILQNIKELEKKALFDKYVSLRNKITNAEVLKVADGYAEIRIGKLETKLPEKEIIPGEKLLQGDLIKVHVKDIQKTTKGPKILVTRTSPELIIELLTTIVPEIEENIVEIVKIYREPGIRTKIAVKSNDKDVDAVGACIGENSMRINELLNELKVEKVDIIQYSDNPEIFIKNALAPAEVKNISIDEENTQAVVYVPEDQFSLAIGKGGQTARTAAKITGWKIDIHTV
ncbi:transcription termination factor NusA [Oceanotoga sp. DSM 15011]|uniref:Transcription termination/antitermination protein NusA n=1 Tax=Oceanotoga teriensis TaxID=515440 RepID=A0AA45C652_9BACT|nr:MULTISPECIES: transcription termination factor NusA [Oceanotoga]MDN5343841.1 transcription termination/antitermination protein NusA [Oceanotoga sp.]MDO7977580.1 transcription termination factor NusA [Oceanotoga teriensis]PWJ91200.1 NusA antitermination factor [Oceanotoga teriensis]UYO99675.1 transcription termination factor NusA [Oceanotoga sp. DSM 15011]